MGWRRQRRHYRSEFTFQFLHCRAGSGWIERKGWWCAAASITARKKIAEVLRTKTCVWCGSKEGGRKLVHKHDVDRTRRRGRYSDRLLQYLHFAIRCCLAPSFFFKPVDSFAPAWACEWVDFLSWLLNAATVAGTRATVSSWLCIYLGFRILMKGRRHSS